MNSNFSRFAIQLFCGLTLFAVSILGGGCNRARHLSDEELAMVFHDAFLANAYTMSTGLQLDSLKLYEPIFNKYGYSVEDVQQTIGNFSRRKSARLSDVVERAITMLEEEGKRLDYSVAILDTVDNIAKRRASRVVYKNPGFHFNSLRDTMKHQFTINDVKAGRYRIEFSYLIDSTDTNRKGYLSQSWSEINGSKRKYNRNNATLNRNIVSNHISYIQIDEEKDKIVIAPVVAQGNTPSMSVRVKNIRITYLPTIEYGRDKIYEELLGIRIFDNGNYGNSQSSI